MCFSPSDITFRALLRVSFGINAYFWWRMKREIMKKKALLVGGTGTISSAVTALLATSPDWELTVLNRGLRPVVLPEGVKVITADVGKDDVGRLIGGEM